VAQGSRAQGLIAEIRIAGGVEILAAPGWYGARIEKRGARPMEPVEPVDDDEASYEEFMRRPSTAPDVGVDLRGFATREQAELVGGQVNGFVQMCGRFLNLRRLKQVIVAWNYDETLAGLDRGVPVARPLTATRDALGVGIAMAPAILDEGEARSVIVFNALHMSIFAEPERTDLEEQKNEMIYTIIHECAHVHDLEMREKCLPGVVLKLQHGPRDELLYGLIDPCWDEYIACRLSAPFAKESTLRGYEEVFCKSLDGARSNADAAIRQYRMHRDIQRLLDEAAGSYKRLLTYGAYLIGHLDGLGRDVNDAAPEAMTAIERNDWFKPFFDRLKMELQAMHANYGAWEGMAVYEPLKRLADEVLKESGIEIQARPDGGAYINVPFRAGTIPSLAEQIAFRSANGDISA
jgi:hypothetical protein